MELILGIKSVNRMNMWPCFQFVELNLSLVSLLHSELNDTVVEAKLRTRQVPPFLPNKDAINRYLQSNNRLLILVCTF